MTFSISSNTADQHSLVSAASQTVSGQPISQAKLRLSVSAGSPTGDFAAKAEQLTTRSDTPTTGAPVVPAPTVSPDPATTANALNALTQVDDRSYGVPKSNSKMWEAAILMKQFLSERRKVNAEVQGTLTEMGYESARHEQEFQREEASKIRSTAMTAATAEIAISSFGAADQMYGAKRGWQAATERSATKPDMSAVADHDYAAEIGKARGMAIQQNFANGVGKIIDGQGKADQTELQADGTRERTMKELYNAMTQAQSKQVDDDGNSIEQVKQLIRQLLQAELSMQGHVAQM